MTGPNGLRALAAARRPALGCWCTLANSFAAEAVSAAGFDLVIVDLQHGALSWDAVGPVVQAVELGGATVIVRVAWNDAQSLMKALDVGAAGVIIPMVDDAASARLAAQAMRYPPLGNRSYGPARRQYPPPHPAPADVVCLPMIETAAGLRNVEAIAATDGVDGLFVGPADLGLALGIGFDATMSHPVVLEAMDTIVAAANRHGRIVGTVASSQAHAADLLARGVHFVTLGSDKSFLAAGAGTALASLTAARDQTPADAAAGAGSSTHTPLY